MSTIASPRASVSASSRRTSTASTDTTTSRQPPAGAGGAGSLRRNRTALRDYYNLKAPPDSDHTDVPSTPALDASHDSELDKPDFDAQAYVHNLLGKEGLEGILRVEAGLVGEIRSLDGEKKALVYDNYSKLIAATETIRRMRERTEPVADAQSLMSQITQVAETAAELRSKHSGRAAELSADALKQQQQRETARWVLEAPERLRTLVADDRREEAEAEMAKVSQLLQKWQNVAGVDDVRRRCEEALQAG